jgi:hypothetical protein
VDGAGAGRFQAAHETAGGALQSDMRPTDTYLGVVIQRYKDNGVLPFYLRPILRKVFHFYFVDKMPSDRIAREVKRSLRWVDYFIGSIETMIYLEERNPLALLSTRTQNALNHEGLWTREEVLAAVLSGKLKFSCRVRNYGKKAHEEVCQWLGIKLPKKKKRCCPHCGKEI